MPKLPFIALGLTSLLALSACSEETCGVAGTTQACLCPTGAMGAQSCQADGTFSACGCDGPTVDAGPVDGGEDAGPPSAECGDGMVTGTEECDLGAAANDGSYGGCNPDCTSAASCGDGTLQALEGCGPLPGGLLYDWNFYDGTADNAVSSDGNGLTVNGATIVDGALVLDGVDDFVVTTLLETEISERTMVAWVRLANTEQRAGGAFTLQQSEGVDTFDAIAFGESTAGQWTASSEVGARTVGDNGGAVETSTELHMLAIAYDASNGITLYRDGVEYAARYSQGTLQTYPAGASDVMLGIRHEDLTSGAPGTETGEDPYLAGAIERAMIFSRALDRAEIRDVFVAGPGTNLCLDDCPACVPQCTDRACGDDGCGGSCGACDPLDECRAGDESAVCQSIYQGDYQAGTFQIVTDRTTCTGRMGVQVSAEGTAIVYGEDRVGGTLSPSYPAECRGQIVGSGTATLIVETVPNGPIEVVAPNRLVGNLTLDITLDAGGGLTSNTRIDAPFEGTVSRSSGEVSAMLTDFPRDVTIGDGGLTLEFRSVRFEVPEL